MKIFSSIKYKLFYFAISQVIIAIVVLALVVFYTENESFKKKSINELNGLCQFIGVTAESSLLFEQYDEIHQVLKTIEEQSKVDAVWVVVNDKEVASYKKNSLVTYPKKLSLTGLASEEGVYSRTEIKSEGEKIGEVIMRGNLNQLNEDLSELFWRIMFISIVILGLITLLVFILQTSISKPISKLSDVAQQIRKGNLQARVKVNSKDEIGELGEVFNEMLEQIVYEKEMSDLVLLTRNKFFSSIGKKTKEEVTTLKLLIEKEFNTNDYPTDKKGAMDLILKEGISLTNSLDDILRITSKEKEKLRFVSEQIDADKLFYKIQNSYNSNSIELRNKLNINQGELVGFLGDFNRFEQLISYPIYLCNNVQQGMFIKLDVSLTKNKLILDYSANFESEIVTIFYNLKTKLKSEDKETQILEFSTIEEEVFLRILRNYNGNMEYNSKDQNMLSITVDVPSENPPEKLKFKNKKVLLIEPNLVQANEFKEIIEEQKGIVQIGATGNDLFDLLKYNYKSFDVVVTEVDLPLKDCFMAFKEFLEEERTEYDMSKVIISTSNSSNILRSEAEQLGIKHILKKPYLTSDLLDCIQKAINS